MGGLVGPDMAHGELVMRQRHPTCDLRGAAPARKEAKGGRSARIDGSPWREGTEHDTRPGSEDPDGLERADALE